MYISDIHWKMESQKFRFESNVSDKAISEKVLHYPIVNTSKLSYRSLSHSKKIQKRPKIKHSTSTITLEIFNVSNTTNPAMKL